MQIAEAQAEVRNMYLGGSIGAIVSGMVWLIAASLATWSTQRLGMQFLVFGGMAIFPIGQGILLLMGRPATLPPQNALKGLAMQIAFTLPLSLPLVGAATLANPDWFFPAMMLIVGVHYLPFIFLYGMWQYGALAALLIACALWIGVQAPEYGLMAGWLTAGVEILFGAGILGWWYNSARTEASGQPA